MRIAITGGKGGTGKSTIATALAAELAKKHRTILVDADVECPDDHIILSTEREKIREVEIFLPEFDKQRCLKCGECSQICKENAIVLIRDNFPFLVDKQCNGCGACLLACPNRAISEDAQTIGCIYLGKPVFDTGIAENLILISGEIYVGLESTSPVVKATLDYAFELEDDYDFLLIDTAAGTHCNVSTALMDSDLALAVAEPTPLGKHDLDLILKLLELLKIQSVIILNKSDIGDIDLIKEIQSNHGIDIISKVPYTKTFLENYSKGIPITHKEISEIAQFLENRS